MIGPAGGSSVRYWPHRDGYMVCGMISAVNLYRSPVMHLERNLMNSTYSAVVSGAILIASSFVAKSESTFDLPLHFAPGDKLVVEYIQWKNKDGQRISGNFVAELSVDDVYEDGYLATWTTLSVVAGGVAIDFGRPQAKDYLLGVPIKFVADKDGAPLRIHEKNVLLSSIFDGPLFSEYSDETTERVRRYFESMSEEVLAQALLTVPTIMSLCQGTSLRLGERNEEPTIMPSPVGGEPADATISYLLKEFDRQGGRARIEYRLDIDPESSKKMILEALSQAELVDKEGQSEVEGYAIERYDSASCDIGIEGGWAETISFETRVQVGDRFQQQNFEITIERSSPSVE
jgi:hypothetical protein